MELCCTYIETDKFMEVISFYEKILQIKPNIYTENRWVEFECGNKLAIYNRKFDEEKIKILSESIKNYGVLQPIVLKPDDKGKYMIIAGERRYRAYYRAILLFYNKRSRRKFTRDMWRKLY